MVYCSSCHPRNGVQSLSETHIHMMCDAIRMEEDYTVHTMILNLSDEDESYFDSYNESEQEHNSDEDMSLSSLSSSLSSSSSSSSSSTMSSIANALIADE